MREPARGKFEIRRRDVDALLFDMDGVITRTADVHAAAWKQTFDELLKRMAGADGSFVPFDLDADYRRYVDGRPRYDGVASFLASRRISLPYGSTHDPPTAETVCGIGNRKDEMFLEVLSTQGVAVFESTIALLRSLREAGIKTGVFSASRNAERVLAGANVTSLFDAKVDGLDAERLGLAGKPEPGTLLELARRLGATPDRAVVIEDAVAGVQAGRAGRFALVIGVNRTPRRGMLLEAGADVEVTDLAEVALLTE